MFRTFALATGFALVVCGVHPTCAEAQTPSIPTTASLSLSASANEDVNSGDPAAGGSDLQYQGQRLSSSLQAGLNARGGLSKMFWQVGASTGFQHYPSLHEVLPTGQSANVGIAFPVSKRTTVQVSGGLSYIPNYSLQLAPSPAAAAPTDAAQGTIPDVVPETLVGQPDFSVVRQTARSSSALVSISQNLGPRTSFTGSYSSQRTNFLQEGTPDLTSGNAHAAVKYQFSKYGGIHVGYGRRFGDYELASGVTPARLDDLDVGIDYNRNRQIALSRKTTASFSSGGTIQSDEAGGRHFSLTGVANLNYAISRTSNALLSFTRGVQLVQGFAAPVSSDTLTGSLNLRPTPRASFMASIASAKGTVGAASAGSVDNAYFAFTSSARMSFALSRTTGMFLSYSGYQHKIGNAVVLVDHLSNLQRRQSVQVGVTTQLPLIQAPRRGGK